MPRRKAIAIVGPTASGKSDVAMKLAKLVGGEIISADSMQVYKGMDVGTAKPTAEDVRMVKHHLIDVCKPDEPMSVARYCELAEAAYDDISSRGSVAIIAGGTGLYVDAATRGFLFPDKQADEKLRAELYARADAEGSDALHTQLEAVDPLAASRIHANDTRRLVRALEVFNNAGKPISELQKLAVSEPCIPAVFYGVNMDRALLVERIEARVDRMMEQGLLEEVAGLVAEGFAANKVAMQAIGYKELIEHLKGGISKEAAVDLIKAETRKYSKRQMTWFRRHKDIMWFDSGLLDPKQIAEAISRDYEQKGME